MSEQVFPYPPPLNDKYTKVLMDFTRDESSFRCASNKAVTQITMTGEYLICDVMVVLHSDGTNYRWMDPTATSGTGGGTGGTGGTQANIVPPTAGLRHVYSQLQPWNQAMDRIIMQDFNNGGVSGVYDWPTFGNQSLVVGTRPRWNSNELISVDANTVYKDGVSFFTPPWAMAMDQGYERISETQEMLLIRSDFTEFGILRLDTGAFAGPYSIPAGQQDINWMSVSPSGVHVLVQYNTSGPARTVITAPPNPTGVGTWTLTKTGATDKSVTWQTPHSDVYTVPHSTGNRDHFVFQSQYPLSERTGVSPVTDVAIMRHDLRTGAEYMLHQTDWSPEQMNHISTGATNQSTAAYNVNNRLYVNVKGVAHQLDILPAANVNTSVYIDQAHAVLSHDGNWVGAVNGTTNTTTFYPVPQI